MFPKVIEQFIQQFSRLPGIGTRTSERLAFYLVSQNDGYVRELDRALLELKEEARVCEICGNISDTNPCHICADENRDQSVLCVVENVTDLYSIEAVQAYKGLYQVLGGLIDPLNGMTPEDLRIGELVSRIRESQGRIQEIIFATGATPEGDTTILYIKELLKDFPIKTTHLARGIPVGTGLQYAGQRSLSEAFRNRESFS